MYMVLILDMFLLTAAFEGEESNDGEEKPMGGDGSLPPGHVPQEGEPDFVETNCHWEDCSKEFDTQEELVKVNYLCPVFNVVIPH